MSKGYVYILSNPAMPGIVKIGKTARCVDARASELYQTGVPAPFNVEHKVLSPDCSDMESVAHDEFSEFRVSAGREFFRVEPSIVHQYLLEVLEEQVGLLVEEFMPDHSLVESDLFVDPATILVIAKVSGVPASDVSQVLEEIRCDDEEFNFGVLKARLGARRVRDKTPKTVQTEGIGGTVQ